MKLLLFALLTATFLTAPLPEPPPADRQPRALYLSPDGNRWDDLTEGLPDSVMAGQVLEVGADLYLTAFPHGLFYLPEGDCVWQSIGSGLPPAGKVIYSAFAGTEELLVLGTQRWGLYVSRDGGRTWTHPERNVDDRMVLSLAVHRGQLYAGTDAGLWQSRDGGRSWSLTHEENTAIYGLHSRPEGLVVARQNGLGLLVGDALDWSALRTDWAVTQLLSEGEFTYALTAGGEVLRTTDGTSWMTPDGPARDRSRHAATDAGLWPREWQPRGITKTLHTNDAGSSLGEALWRGYWPSLPAQLPTEWSIRVAQGNRGWMVWVRSGC